MTSLMAASYCMGPSTNSSGCVARTFDVASITLSTLGPLPLEPVE